MIFDKKKREDEIFEIRQKVYSKLNLGRNVYSSMRMFQWKVEKYLRTFRTKLSYDEEKKWRDKVVITKKAVVRIRNERKATLNAVRAQELLIENLPDPPKDDEVEETLRKLKKLNEENETFDDEDEVAVVKEMKREVTEVKDDKMKDVKIGKIDTKENGKNETAAKKVMEAKAMKVKIVNEENESKEYEAEEEISENLYDKIVPKSVSFDDEMSRHDMKYMQVLSGTGKKDELDSRMDASTIVSTLHIIFAMVIICGKILHKQSLLIARLSQLSQPSLLSQLKPESL